VVRRALSMIGGAGVLRLQKFVYPGIIAQDIAIRLDYARPYCFHDVQLMRPTRNCLSFHSCQRRSGPACDVFISGCTADLSEALKLQFKCEEVARWMKSVVRFYSQHS